MPMVSAMVRHDKKIFLIMYYTGTKPGQTDMYCKVYRVTKSLQERNRTVKSFQLYGVSRELLQKDLVKH